LIIYCSYEGTGRSLSLKLIKQLRDQTSSTGASVGLGGRSLREITLNDPIRYNNGDGVESWLNTLLCLDATVVKSISSGCPHPSECELYYVNRDTLFSYHKASEAFLQRMMALYVSSHYKNSPNDLQLMADAPSHHLFVLLPPVNKDTNTLPEILCVIQVCLEGEISAQSVRSHNNRGQRPAGDLIPWTVSQQFQDEDFPSLSGARVVRIATHPDFQKMGYGSRSLQLLQSYYEGKITNLAEASMEVDGQSTSKSSKSTKGKDSSKSNGTGANLQEEDLKPRRDLPPLLLKLSERPAERLNYLGVSFGLTPQLFSYWKKAGFVPVYLRLTPNELTGEHTMIMLYQSPETQEVAMSCSPDWLNQFNEDFRKRFLSLLSYEFRTLSCEASLLIANAKVSDSLKQVKDRPPITRDELDNIVSIHDIKRLEGYANSLLDYHVIIDLFPTLARLFFTGRFPKSFTLTAGQQLFLIGLGHQHKTVDDIARELSIEASQVMSYLQKIVRKIVKHFNELEQKDEMKKLPQYLTSSEIGMAPLVQTLDEDLAQGAIAETSTKKMDKETERQQEELLNSLSLGQYAISETAQDWSGNAALKKNTIPNMISVRSLKDPAAKAEDGKPSKKKRKMH
jgi:N-acetyltransferase 10